MTYVSQVHSHVTVQVPSSAPLTPRGERDKATSTRDHAAIVRSFYGPHQLVLANESRAWIVGYFPMVGLYVDALQVIDAVSDGYDHDGTCVLSTTMTAPASCPCRSAGAPSTRRTKPKPS